MQNTVHRKPRTIQMSYPAPYSQSWANTNPVEMGIDKTKKSSSFQGNRNKLNQPTYNCCSYRRKPPTHGCDPYAPHLKYGVFPKKVTRREPTNKLPIIKKNLQKEEARRTYEYMDKNRKEQQITAYTKERRLAESPIYVIRPIDQQYARQLSLSQVTHIDIRPRQSEPFPSIQPSTSARLRRRNCVNLRL